MNHKKECGRKGIVNRNDSLVSCSSLSQPTITIKQSNNSLSSHLSLPTSPTLPTSCGVILSESDLLSLTTSLDHNIGSISTISPSALHITNDNSLGTGDGSDTFSAVLSGINTNANSAQVIHTSNSGTTSQTLGLPVSLINSLVSTPFLVQTSNSNNTACNTTSVTLPSNFVLNLTNTIPNNSSIPISAIPSTNLTSITQSLTPSKFNSVNTSSVTIPSALKVKDPQNKANNQQKKQLDAAIHVLPSSDLKASTHKTRKRINKNETNSTSNPSSPKRSAKLKCTFCDRKS